MSWRDLFRWRKRTASAKDVRFGFAPDAMDTSRNDRDDLARAIEDLVERTRLGEQNAKSHLVILDECHALVTSGRFPGSPSDARRVERSYAAWKAYEKANPPGADCDVCVHASPAHPDRLALAARGADPVIGLGPGPRTSFGADGHVGATPLGRPRLRVPVAISRSLPPPLPEEALAGLRGISMFGGEDSPQGANNLCAILVAMPDAGGLQAAPASVVLLALGPELGLGRLTAARDSIADVNGRRAFEASAKDPFAPPKDRFGFAGFVVGNAKRLQAVMRQGAPPEILHPDMAWELGQ